MIEARSILIRVRGHTRVLRLSRETNGMSGVWFLSYRVRHRAPMCERCGCTEKHGCLEGCYWIDARQTLCSRCEGRMIVR